MVKEEKRRRWNEDKRGKSSSEGTESKMDLLMDGYSSRTNSRPVLVYHLPLASASGSLKGKGLGKDKYPRSETRALTIIARYAISGRANKAVSIITRTDRKRASRFRRRAYQITCAFILYTIRVGRCMYILICMYELMQVTDGIMEKASNKRNEVLIVSFTVTCTPTVQQ